MEKQIEPSVLAKILFFVVVAILIIAILSNYNPYLLADRYNDYLEPTNIIAVARDHNFRNMNLYVMKNLQLIQKDISALLLKLKCESMYNFDNIHKELMMRSRAIHGWKTRWLRYLCKNTDFVDYCPEIRKLFDRFGEMFLNMSISLLAPGAEIPPHIGSSRAVVKYHIPIYIPKAEYGDLCLHIDGSLFTWSNRSSLLFDDTHIHSVWNRTNEARIILMCDIFRPMGKYDILNHRVAKLVAMTPDAKDTYLKINKG